MVSTRALRQRCGKHPQSTQKCLKHSSARPKVSYSLLERTIDPKCGTLPAVETCLSRPRELYLAQPHPRLLFRSSMSMVQPENKKSLCPMQHQGKAGEDRMMLAHHFPRLGC